MYKIILGKAADKFIRRQSKPNQQRLYDSIKQLPNGRDIKKLRGFDNKYRMRVGNYRIIYDKYDDVYIIEVVNVDNRGQVYKGL